MHELGALARSAPWWLAAVPLLPFLGWHDGTVHAPTAVVAQPRCHAATPLLSGPARPGPACRVHGGRALLRSVRKQNKPRAARHVSQRRATCRTALRPRSMSPARRR
jgi:hypothetical protein